MEKSYLKLENRSVENITREVKMFLLAAKSWSDIPHDDPRYLIGIKDCEDKMAGFRNYFSQDLETVIKSLAAADK